MKNLIVKLGVLFAVLYPAVELVSAVVIAGYRNVDDVKAVAEEVWSQSGFQVNGYQGYQWGPTQGGYVWYSLKREDSPDILYQGALAKWGDEYHIYSLEAIDAIKP